jgi:hypothetical protein
MVSHYFWHVTLCSAAILITSAGCGSGNSGPAVYPVEGEVFYKGKPAAGCIVSFHPQGGVGPETGWPSMGTADTNGKFRLTTRLANDGAPAGQYDISFSWPGEPSASDPTGDTAPDRLPQKYQFPASSGFNVTVEAKDNSIPRFELK